MAEQVSSNEALRDLRLSADQGDWNGCYAAMESLILHLPKHRSLRMVCDQVARRLPLFERHQPGVRWPRELIEAVSQARSSEQWRRPQEDDFSGPGANSFISAVESLWSATRPGTDERHRAAALVDATAGVIMAEKLEFWGSRHIAEWALWCQLAREGNDDPRIVDIQLAIKRAPEAAAVQRSAWREVADTLEAELRNGGRGFSQQ